MKKSLFFVIIFLSQLQLFAAESAAVKVALMEKMFALVMWPPQKETVFSVCVYEEDDVYEAASKLYKGIQIKSLDVAVKEMHKTEDITASNCQALFVGAKAAKKTATAISSKPILTFSSVNDEQSNAIMINFLIQEGKIKYEVNQKKILDSGLKAHYILLKNASKIKEAVQ